MINQRRINSLSYCIRHLNIRVRKVLILLLIPEQFDYTHLEKETKYDRLKKQNLESCIIKRYTCSLNVENNKVLVFLGVGAGSRHQGYLVYVIFNESVISRESGSAIKSLA